VEAKSRILTAMRAIDFKGLKLPDGSIEATRWKDDGRHAARMAGRTGAVRRRCGLLQRRISRPPRHAPLRVMSDAGRPWQGTGFISEIQSLFHPDFDGGAPDAAVSKVNWLGARRTMLQRAEGLLPQDAAREHGRAPGPGLACLLARARTAQGLLT